MQLHPQSEVACSWHEDDLAEESADQPAGPLGIGPARVENLPGAT